LVATNKKFVPKLLRKKYPLPFVTAKYRAGSDLVASILNLSTDDF